MQDAPDFFVKSITNVIECPHCHAAAIKYGKNKRSKQRYRCKICLKTFLIEYRNKAYNNNIDLWLIALLKESCGIRSISRLLDISVTTVIRRISAIAARISKPVLVFGR